MALTIIILFLGYFIAAVSQLSKCVCVYIQTSVTVLSGDLVRTTCQFSKHSEVQVLKSFLVYTCRLLIC